MTRRLIGAVLSCVLAVAVGGCIPLAIEKPQRNFHVASTDGPVTLTFPIGARGDLSIRYHVSGIAAVDLDELGAPPCTDSDSVYVSLALRVTDPDTNRVLHERDLLGNPACHGDRFVWDGDNLIELEEGEPWPEDLYERPLPSPPPG